MSEKDEYYPWNVNSSLTTNKHDINDNKSNKKQNTETLQNKISQITKKRKLNIQSK